MMSDTHLPAVPDESPKDEHLPTDIFEHLTLKEAVAVRHYVQIGDKGQSLRAAGYRHSTSRQPDKVFARPHVARALERWQDYVTARAAVSAEEILAGLHFIATHDMGAIFEPGTWTLKPIEEWPEDYRRAVQKVKVRIDPKTGIVTMEVEFPDRVKALELLGKHKQLWEPKKSQGKQYTLIINNQGSAGAQEPTPEQVIDAGSFQIRLPPKSPDAQD